MTAAEAPDGNVKGNDFLTLFGRPSRKSACECERTNSLSLSHALNLINGGTIGEAVDNPNSKIAKIVNSQTDDKKVVEELFYTILSRPPSEKEISSVNLTSAPSRMEGAQDLAWALMNSPSFLFNR